MIDEDLQENEQESIQEQVSPAGAGARLSEARRALNLSKEDIAKRLNYRADLVDAIENEDYSRLPAAIYICGYLRSYAKLVDLPADEIVNGFPKLEDAMQPVLSVQEQGNKKQALPQIPITKLLYGGMVAVVLVAGWALWQNFGLELGLPTSGNMVADDLSSSQIQKTKKTNSKKNKNEIIATNKKESVQAAIIEDTDAKIKNIVVIAPEPDMSNSLESIDDNTDSSTEDITEIASTAAEFAPDTEKLVTTSTSEMQKKNEASVATINNNISQLEIKFTGLCWVELYDANGERLIYELGRKGKIFNVKGKAPFEIVLGYAKNAIVNYNGKPYDVVSGSNSVVVKSSLGSKQDNR